MGLYERVNERYAKTFYSKEFEQEWKTWKPMIESLGLVEATMVTHHHTMRKANSKKDIYLDGPIAFGYLIDALERNRIPLLPNDLFIPAMVHSVYKVTPAEKVRYKDSLVKMIASGLIPKSSLETFPTYVD
jgi:hypothetical protein